MDERFDLGAIARGLLTSIFPPVCAACGRAGREPFCRFCEETIEPAPGLQIEGADAARALWSYAGPIVSAIRALKYEGRSDLGRSLGLALRPKLAELAPIDCVVPVPLSRARLASRGYNQARELARGLDLGVKPFALVRKTEGRDQVGLDKRARLENLKGAFIAGKQAVKGLRVLLLDDVVTTGATASAASKALRDAGARQVVVLALAHTP
jgi:ComF family protein